MVSTTMLCMPLYIRIALCKAPVADCRELSFSTSETERSLPQFMIGRTMLGLGLVANTVFIPGSVISMVRYGKVRHGKTALLWRLHLVFANRDRAV